jgi:hypothetical protein
MRRYWILCGLLLLSLVPLSCSQKECEWRRDIANFHPEAYRVLSGYKDQTEPFSVKGEKIAVRWAANLSASRAGEGISSGSLSIDVYRYPDMDLVASPVDETRLDEEGKLELVEVEAGNGMYCLYISSSAYVVWAVAVDEWVCP